MSLIVEEVEVITTMVWLNIMFGNCILKMFFLEIKIIMTFLKILIKWKSTFQIMFKEKHGSSVSSKCWSIILGNVGIMVESSIHTLLKVVFHLQALLLAFEKFSETGL